MPIKISEQCSRCPREEQFEVTLDEAVERSKAREVRDKALVIMIDGQQAVSYDYLCDECRGIVVAYCDGTKRQQKKSARRVKRMTVEAEIPKQRAV
jgi:hypothetical protein